MTALDLDPDALASREPYYAAIPASEFLRENLTAENERAFFASGEALVDWLFRVIEPAAPEFAPVSGLEYGCGVGRLALPLARRTGTMVGVDRSAASLAIARAEAVRRGVDNVTFTGPEDVFGTDRKFDLVVCYLGLQRLELAGARALIDTLVGRIGPGGVGVFDFPYDDRAPAFVKGTRWIRAHFPAANRVANRWRRKSLDEPFLPARPYPLDAMLRQLRRTPMGATHVVLDQNTDVGRATAFLWMPHASDRARHRRRGGVVDDGPTASPRTADGVIDVRELIATASIEELNRTAEAYLAALTDWSHHLAKPFAKPDEVGPLLKDVATIIQGLRLEPGLSVLEYGAGTGWLSRYVTQLGCQATLLDVSPTALRIAQELYARLPVIGEQPSPRFLPFDGRHIDLADHSVDRVVAFHAFHHAANADEVLREFGRVLKPGGIAAFAEPGPHHSRSAQSQFEMRTYSVVENDVDVHAIWRTARACGFSDLTLAVAHDPPFHVSLAEFDDLLTGGRTADAWLVSTRRYLRNVRKFFLTKGGSSRRDSGSTEGLACEVSATVARSAQTPGEAVVIDATVTNTGVAVWLPWPGRGGVALGAHLYDDAGGLLNFDLHCTPLADPSREIPPGEVVRLRVTLPPLDAGRYRVELDCVASGVAWFGQLGSRPAVLHLDVTGIDAPQ